ncbi:MAG: apolipoprotein N-acyltransferase [Burkholderiales bacterium]|nr:apolipoprotein N-acyltransferase [Burkholderiales bacterium]
MLAGGLNVLSFDPVGWWPVQCLSLAFLFSLILRERPSDDTTAAAVFTRRQIGWLAWSYSFSWLFGTISWLLIAMTRYGDMPVGMSLLALALLTAFLAMYAGLFGVTTHWLRQRWQTSAATTGLLLMPALWTLGEWLRSWLLTGFPWTISGYAHTSSPLAGYAPLIGVLGVGWLNAVLAGLLALAWRAGMATRHGESKTTWRTPVAVLIVGATLLFGIGQGLRQVAWTQPHGAPISVSLLQGNVAQDVKFDQEHLNESLSLYHDMILAAPADLVATPETALPMLSSQLPVDYLPLLNAFAQRSGSAVLIGLGVHDGGSRYSNSLLGFSPLHQARAYRYDKHHLVPFGEFVPLGFRWLVDMMKIPLGDFSSAGIAQAPMAVRDQFVMPNICYEDLFGDEIAQQLFAQNASSGPVATILLNASNMAWYGDSFAIPQHLQLSKMRVLETGRPMLRATNTGATAVIDVGAGLVAELPPLTRGTLRATVQGRSGMTPYVMIGNAGVLILVLLSIAVAWWMARQRS